MIGAVEREGVVGQRSFDGLSFPLILSPSHPFDGIGCSEWIVRNASELRKRLLLHGAVLFRDFPIETGTDFEAMLDAAGFENMPYVGGAAPRQVVTARRVLTANESPPSEPIPFHHEMAQVPNPPGFVFFLCERSPATGGETPIVLSHRVYDRLKLVEPLFLERLEMEGVRYVRVMPDQDDPSSAIGRSWRSTFQTQEKAEAEERMRAAGTQWEWLATGDLRTMTAALPAVRVEPRSGRKTFFNSVVAAYTGWIDSRNDPRKAVIMANGTPVDGGAVSAAAQIMEMECAAIPWKKGDMLWLDNSQVLHSRRPYTGERRILAAIAR